MVAAGSTLASPTLTNIQIFPDGTTILSIQSIPLVYYTCRLPNYDNSGQISAAGMANIPFYGLNPGAYTASIVVADTLGSQSIPYDVSWVVSPRIKKTYSSSSDRIEARKQAIMKQTKILYP